MAGQASLLHLLYTAKVREFEEKLGDMLNPRVVFITDLVSCSHKRLLRLRYPLLAFRFEPPLVMGDLVHTGLELLASQRGWEPEVEVTKSYVIDGEEYLVKGRADLVLRGEDGSVEVVAEIKTAREPPREGKPHEHHLLQVKIYAELLGAKEALLVYITPDALLEYKVEVGGVSIEDLLLETVADARAPRWEWECRYCPYRRICEYARARRQ